MNRHTRKQAEMLQKLADELALASVEPLTLEQLKNRSTSAVNSAFERMDRTTHAYTVERAISALMKEYAQVRFEPDSAFVKALEKQCKAENFFQTRRLCTVFKFDNNYATFWNEPDSDYATEVQISRYIP